MLMLHICLSYSLICARILLCYFQIFSTSLLRKTALSWKMRKKVACPRWAQRDHGKDTMDENSDEKTERMGMRPEEEVWSEG